MIGPLKNLFGGKKDNFFLEFDDAEGTSTAPAAPPAAPVAEVPQPVEQKAPKAAVKKSAKKQAAAKKVAPEAPAAAPVAAAPTASAPKVAVLFAPDNLAPQPTGNRRRPGPSLNGFKDMAKTMGRR